MLVRIYELHQDDTELVEAITFATNSQNPVDLRDLKANDQRQEDLRTSIAGLGYAYPARGRWKMLPTTCPVPRERSKPRLPDCFKGGNGRSSGFLRHSAART